jgi:hypothetical protein
MQAFGKPQDDEHYTNLSVGSDLVAGKSISTNVLNANVVNYNQLNPPVLGGGGGGEFVVDPTDPAAYQTIQDAVDDAMDAGASFPDNQKTVLIAAGNYVEDVVIGASGIHLKGIGPSGICGLDALALVLVTSPGVKIEGTVTIDAPNIALQNLGISPPGLYGLFYTSNAGGTTWLSDLCILILAGATGIHVDAVADLVLLMDNCYVGNPALFNSITCVRLGGLTRLRAVNCAFTAFMGTALINTGTGSMFLEACGVSGVLSYSATQTDPGGLVRVSLSGVTGSSTFLVIPVGATVNCFNCIVNSTGTGTILAGDGSGGTGGSLRVHNLMYDPINVGNPLPTDLTTLRIATNGPVKSNVITFVGPGPHVVEEAASGTTYNISTGGGGFTFRRVDVMVSGDIGFSPGSIQGPALDTSNTWSTIAAGTMWHAAGSLANMVVTLEYTAGGVWKPRTLLYGSWT